MPDDKKIPFDYLGAKKAGYSDDEIKGFLKDKYAFDFDITGAKKSGYSDKEVADYITAYEPPVKKKDWVSDFFTGSKNGNSPSSSIGEALGKTAEISPPAGRAITTGGTFKKNERPFDQTKEEAISGATKKLSDIMYGDGNDWKDPIKASLKGIDKSKSIKETLDSYGAKVLTEESLMPNGYDAKRVLSSSHFGQEGDDNLTSKALRDKVIDYEKTVAPFRELGDIKYTDQRDFGTRWKIYDAAIRAYANKNEHFKKQLESAGVDINKDDIMLSMGDNHAKAGQIMNTILQNPDLHTFLQKENPNLLPAIQKIQEDLIYDNKDFGRAQLANEISRDMEKEGYNKIDPIFNFEGNAKKAGDVTAESLYLNDPKKLQFYRENKDEILNKLDAPSLFTGFAEAGKGFGKGLLNTFTEPFTSTSKTIKDNWEKEASHVSADPQGLVKFFSDSGHALGFVASIGATGNVLGGIGLTPNAANMTSLGVGFLGDNLEQAKLKYPGSPVKQWTSALFNTGLYMAMGKSLFPASKVEQALAKVNPGVSKVIENLASGKITRDAARAELNSWGKKAIEIAGDGLKNNLKVSAEMTGITILNKTLDRLLGTDDQTFAEYHPEGEEADTFKSMFLSNIIVNGMAAYGQAKAKNNIAKESVYEAVNYPNRYRSVIEGAAISKNIAETKDMLDNLDYLVGIKKDLDTRGLSEKQKKDYLFNALKSRVLNASKPASPDATLTRQHSERIKDIEEINQGILEGKDADEVVTTSEQKKIDEQDKNDTELERLTKAKELDQKEYDEKRGELDGRRPEDRIKIEKLEQAQKEKNEDYDKKIAKLTPKVEEPITLDQDRDLMDEGSEFESRPKEEILVDVPDAANGIADKGVREAFLTNPERGLAEVAQQLHSTTGEAETASNTYGNKIADLALELYPTRESADKALTPTPKGNTSNVGGDVEAQYNARKKSIEDKLDKQLENNKDRLDDIDEKGGTKTVRQKIYQEHTNDMVELEKWKMKEDLKSEKSDKFDANKLENINDEYSVLNKKPSVKENIDRENVGFVSAKKDYKKANEISDKIKLLRSADGSISEENMPEYKRLRKEYDALEQENNIDRNKRVERQPAKWAIDSFRDSNHTIGGLDEVYALKKSLKKDGYTDAEIDYIIGDIVGNKSDLGGKSVAKRFDEINKNRQSLSKQESGGKAPVTKPNEKVAELEKERDAKITKEGKPEVKMEFVTAKELVDSKDPIGNKKIHTDIKDRYKKMRELLDCLWT